MPFQGNQNPPDASRLIGMLLNHQNSLLKMKADAEANAKEELRKQAEHEMKMAKDMADFRAKLDTEAANASALSDTANSKSTPNPERQRAANQFIAAIEQNMARRLGLDPGVDMNQVAAVSGMPGQGALRSAVNQAGTETGLAVAAPARARQQDLNTTIAEENRADARLRQSEARSFDRQLTMKELEYAQSVGRPTDTILQRDATIKQLEILIRDNGKNMSPDQLSLAQDQLDSLYAERQHERLVNLPNEWFKQRRAVAAQLSQYNTMLANRQVLSGLLESSFGDEGAIGAEAVLTRFAVNAEDLVQQLTGMGFEQFYVRAVEQGLANSTATDEAKANARDRLLSDEVLDNIARGELGQVELAWTLNHLFNPSGRVNQKQLDAINDATKFIGLTVGPRLGRSRMRVSIERQDQGLANMRMEMQRLDPSIRFDSETGAPLPNTPYNGQMIQQDLAPRTGREARDSVSQPRKPRDLLNRGTALSPQEMLELRRMEGLNAGS